MASREESPPVTLEHAWWSDRPDIVVFGIIPWSSRWQRPQHFALELARRGHRVVYVIPHFLVGQARWRMLDEPSCPGEIVLVELSTWIKEAIHSAEEWTEDDVSHAHHTFWEMLDALRLRSPVLLVQSPAWWPLLAWIRERTDFPLVYDCLDEHTGWNETLAASVRAWEEALAADADLVLASAESLRERLRNLTDPVLLVPNGCDFEHFESAARPSGVLRPPLAGPIVGYYGAVSVGWFDAGLLTAVAEARPEWSIVVVGPVDPEVRDLLDPSPNIFQLGEIPYADLPTYCAEFDVAIIPFLVNELTAATDPVKLYEYFAAGKPVVTTPLPALYELQGPLLVADSPEAFVRSIESFLRDHGDGEARRAIAREASWSRRVDLFYDRMLATLPSLDVVVLTHDNAALTRRCIASVRADPSYRARLVVVDNASTDETAAVLAELEGDSQAIVIRNERNVGFAAGLNQAVRAGSGRYVLILNNDTELPRGALLGLVGALARSRDVGLLGPVTNSIGNEAQIYAPYDVEKEGALDAWSRRLAWERFGMRFDMRVAALFAAIIRRADFEQIGGIPEHYQVGMFEDDELAERVRRRGKRVVCAEDVFVHHAGRAAFKTLDPFLYQAIFDRNRRIFERATGTTWKPHVYRHDPAGPAGGGDESS